MPSPLSLTFRNTWSLSSAYDSVTCMKPPSTVYFAALDSRLYKILSNLSVSKYPMIESGLHNTEKCIFDFFIKGWKPSVSFLTKAAMSPEETRSFKFPVSAFRNSKICCNKRINRWILLYITANRSVCWGACALSSSTVAETIVSGVNNSWVILVKNCNLAWFNSSAFIFSISCNRSSFCNRIRLRVIRKSQKTVPAANSAYKIYAHQVAQNGGSITTVSSRI